MLKKENAIHQLLRRLGASGNYLGFYYTADAVECLMESNEDMYQCKWLYNEIAKKFRTTPYCVERDIRTVINLIWSHGNMDLMREILPYPTDRKPKNAQFIDALAHYFADLVE